MSHYHHPRINFMGKCTHDPATANNGFYAPLVIYDPLKVSVVLPPRLYFTPKSVSGGDVQAAEALVPDGVKVQVDEDGRFSGVPYIEIKPIDTIEKFKDWAIVPLGDFPDDKAFIPLYKVLNGENTGEPILGVCPGYWNYFGTMKFDFGWKDENTDEDVTVTSVAVSISQNQDVGKVDNNEVLYSAGDKDIPEDIADLLGAVVSMDNIYGDRSTWSAVMIDLDPTFALYTQIFNDVFGIYKANQQFLRGKPCKFSLRFVNVFKIVNETMPNSGSGDFCGTIAIEDMEDADSPVMTLMKKYCDTDRELAGVYIRFNLLEVQENRPPEYQTRGKKPNPAKMTVAGSIGPWYKDEMRSIVMGRQLIPNLPFIEENSVSLPPVVILYDVKRKEFIMDALNWLPMINTEYLPSQPSPPTNTSPKYATYNLGQVNLLYSVDQGPPHTSPIQIGTIQVNHVNMPREQFLASGGILRFPIDLTDKELTRITLLMEGPSIASLPTADSAPPEEVAVVGLMKEASYMIGSDQAGLYATQGDDPSKGYITYGYPKEFCYLRIFSKGAPIKGGLKISVQENKVTAGGGYQDTALLRNAVYKDWDTISFPTDEPCNAMYLLMPYEDYTGQPLGAGPLQGQIIATGSFISLRVLPVHDYGKYLDPGHPEYPTPVTWEVVQREVFNTIVSIYPAMNITKDVWNNNTMAAQIMARIADDEWTSSLYMPPTRDLSDDQKHLLEKWATGLNVAVPLDLGETDQAAQQQVRKPALKSPAKPSFEHLAKRHKR